MEASLEFQYLEIQLRFFQTAYLPVTTRYQFQDWIILAVQSMYQHMYQQVVSDELRNFLYQNWTVKLIPMSSF